MTDLSGAGVRVLLLATSTHRGATLTSVPSVASSFHELRAALVQRCGVRPDRLRPILDPPDAQDMALAVSEEARRAETVLLVYFIGHGLLGPGGELFLAASNTDRLVAGLAQHQALSFSSLRQAVEASRASSVVVVLDCCFSGRVSLGDVSPIPTLAMEPTYGLYLIGSAEQLALAPPDATRTAFTGALLDLLERGDPRGPRLLTLDAVYDAVFRTMRHQQRPLPRRQSGDRSGSLIIAPNRAVPAQA
ncbi:MAG: caspase family protein, partial [Pseudonocardia sp.]|nr:caspase family protein [Pseudonocardia sp.]